MIDFKNATFAKLKTVDNSVFAKDITPLLTQNEHVVSTFQGIRDGVVFTNMRIISVNVQGITGKKRDFTSLPYSKIQLFSVETAGILDLDSELDLWFSGLGPIRFEFTSATNVATICQMISSYVLR